jgi:hypothetical protein
MGYASGMIGIVCVILTIILWIVTLSGDLTLESIGAAAWLTIVVVILVGLQFRS